MCARTVTRAEAAARNDAAGRLIGTIVSATRPMRRPELGLLNGLLLPADAVQPNVACNAQLFQTTLQRDFMCFLFFFFLLFLSFVVTVCGAYDVDGGGGCCCR